MVYADGKFVAMSTSSDSIAARVVALLGLDTDDRFATFAGRVENREIIDAATEKWFAAHTQDEALRIFEEIEALDNNVKVNFPMRLNFCLKDYT
jgi:crotonobetainyl-CoA:carnitine CoA-transferase CaiB-like acyl-CoA transferase